MPHRGVVGRALGVEVYFLCWSTLAPLKKGFGLVVVVTSG